MTEIQLQCPLPLSPESIRMAHGGGGRIMRDLLETCILPAFQNPQLEARHDGALLEMPSPRLAFTTDSYVVSPRFFPGGDIGKLAVIGTCNDLAMTGARPRYLSVGLILEEGLPLDELKRIVASMAQTAQECGVSLVTGDTKVVDKGKGDGLFINTAGIGEVPLGRELGPRSVQIGDQILVSGDLGRHGMAIMSVREGLEFESPIQSDCAPLYPLSQALFQGGIEVHCLRDATRGGLAAVLNEVALDGKMGIRIQEAALPVHPAVAGACEMLGLDPCYVACEGRMVAFVASGQGQKALERLRATPGGEGAVLLGETVQDHPGTVVLRTPFGTRRILDLLSGEQLPRIC